MMSAELSHPGLAAPIGTGITGVSAFLATDYVAADSLDLAVRENGAAPPARAVAVAAHLAAALDFAASAAIVHGALHPRDVLMADDETRLTGIGVASALQRVGVAAPVRRPYTAPERIAGAEWDRRADVFSLAALMHELLWGKRLSGTGDQVAAGLSDIKGGNLPALKRTFARALDDDPRKRFPTAVDFAVSLKEAFPGVKVSAATKRPPVRREIEPRLPLDAPEPSPAHAHHDFDLDLADLHVAEERRFTDVEVAPAIVETQAVESLLGEADDRFEPEVEPTGPTRNNGRKDSFEAGSLIHEPALGPPAGLITQGAEPLTVLDRDPLTVLDRSRSAVWPLALALMLGLALGFAAGFGFSGRMPSSPATEVRSAPPPVAAGREFTEGTVPEAPKPAAPAPDARPKRDLANVPAVPRPDLIGRLLIRSTPAGARAFVDDRDVGRTPAAVRDVAAGAHRVRVTHDGFATEERSVTISRRRPTQAITIALKRPAPVARGAKAASVIPRTAAGVAGVLVVDSRPAGAKVFLDGKLVGTTPMSMSTVTAGEHTIRLERDGYRQWSTPVRVLATGQNRVAASLER